MPYRIEYDVKMVRPRRSDRVVREETTARLVVEGSNRLHCEVQAKWRLRTLFPGGHGSRTELKELRGYEYCEQSWAADRPRRRRPAQVGVA